MATSVGLNMKMTASIAKFQSSMDKVEQKLKAIEHSGKQTASGMKLLAGIEVGKLLVGGLTKVAGLASSAASSVIGFASQAADAADKIGKLATMTGMAEEPLQVFTQMAAYGGVSSTQFGDALQKMSRGLGEAANGTGTAYRALNQLGLSVDDLLKMSPSQQFMKIAAAIDGIEDPAKRSAVAADIFGRSGTKLIPMFEDIEANAASLSQEMLSLGQVLSKDQVNNIEAMNDSFEKVRQTAFKIGSQVVANFAPALTAANNALMEMVKNFEYRGASGGQGVAKLLAETLFDAAKVIADVLDSFVSGFQTVVNAIKVTFGLFIKALEPLAVYTSGSDAAARLGAFGDNLYRAGMNAEKLDLGLGGLVASARLLYDESGNAADGLSVFTKETQAVPSKMQLLAAAAEKATPVVGNFEKAIPGAISKVMDFGTNLVSSARDFGAKLVERADVADKLYGQFQGLVDAGLGTRAELRQLTAVASGTGSAADAAKARLNMLAGSAEMLSSTQERLANKMMSPIERWADQRQNFLEAMGFNPFYVEEQKRLWLAKQKEAVDAQIEEAKKAYIGFKETLGESLGILGEDGSLEIPEPIDPREAINATTAAVGEVVTELKNVWSNVMVGLIG